MVGRINHFKHRPGMGCSLLFLAASMIVGFPVLVVAFFYLSNHPWPIFVAAFIWFAFYVFQGYLKSADSHKNKSFMIGPMASGIDWIRATPLEKTNYITRAFKELGNQERGNVDSAKVIMKMDEYFRETRNLNMGVAFAMGVAVATLVSPPPNKH